MSSEKLLIQKGIDLWLPDLPPLVFEAVSPPAVNHPDAVEGADDQQGAGDADAHGGQHPRHVTRLPNAEVHKSNTGLFSA